MPSDRIEQKLTTNARRVAVYLFALALTVHVCYLCQYARTPFFWAPELDSLYDDLATTTLVPVPINVTGETPAQSTARLIPGAWGSVLCAADGLHRRSAVLSGSLRGCGGCPT